MIEGNAIRSSSDCRKMIANRKSEWMYVEYTNMQQIRNGRFNRTVLLQTSYILYEVV